MGSGNNWTGEATPDSLLLIYCRTSLGLFSNLRHSSYHLSSFLGEFCELGPQSSLQQQALCR